MSLTSCGGSKSGRALSVNGAETDPDGCDLKLSSLGIGDAPTINVSADGKSVDIILDATN